MLSGCLSLVELKLVRVDGKYDEAKNWLQKINLGGI